MSLTSKNWRSDCLALPVRVGSQGYRYNLVRWPPRSTTPITQMDHLWMNGMEPWNLFATIARFPKWKSIIPLLLNLDKVSFFENRPPNDENGFFLSLDENGARKIHVIFAHHDNKFKNLNCLEGAMQQIMSKRATQGSTWYCRRAVVSPSGFSIDATNEDRTNTSHGRGSLSLSHLDFDSFHR